MDEAERRDAVMARLTGPAGPFPLGPARINGVSSRVYLNAPSNLRDLMATGAQWNTRPALTFEDEQQTWAQHTGAVARVAAALSGRLGVRKGDRVAIAMRNYPEWVTAFAAAVSIGAVCVPLNAWWSGDELGRALADCGARVLVADRERSHSLQPHRADLPGLRWVIEVRPGETLLGDEDWATLLADQTADLGAVLVPLHPEDDATILYTSGTTGRPKGSVATHRAHLTTMLNMRVHAEVEAQLALERGEQQVVPPERPTSLIPGPLFHVSYLPRVVAAAVTGAHLVLMHKWDASRALHLIEREGVDSMVAVPTVVRELLDEVERTGTVPASLRTLSTAGAQSTGALIERIRGVLGTGVGSGTGYGMTETCGAMIMIGAHDYFRHPLSVGRPLATSQVRVVGRDGTDVPDGHVGEAWFQGPNVTRGYWNADADALVEGGWLRSGDLVRRDDQGLVYIVDRIKDVVIRAGENVYCSEVEEVLSDHPDVEDSAVLGLPHDLLGEEVVAVLRLQPGATVTADELQRRARTRLAPFKVPTQIHLWSVPLPRNAAGKVLKRELREQLSHLGTPHTDRTPA